MTYTLAATQQTSYPVLGHLPHPLGDPLRFLLELGLSHDLSSYQRCGHKEYFINHPELLREVWQNTLFERTPFTRQVLASVAGAGLLSQEGGV